MDEPIVFVKKEADQSQKNGNHQTELGFYEKEERGFEEEQEREDEGTQDDGIVSFYENQNILDTYFDNLEAQQLRDLGVSLVDANEVSNNIFEQMKSHFNTSNKPSKRKRVSKRLGSSFLDQDALSGPEEETSKSKLTKTELRNGKISRNQGESIHKSANDLQNDSRPEPRLESISESRPESEPEPVSEHVIEMDTFLDESLEVKDDFDFERYKSRVLKSRNRIHQINESPQGGSYNSDSTNNTNYERGSLKVIKISRESENSQLFIWDKIWNALYPHQKEGVLWMWGLYCNNHGGILADEMGLGKSITVASFIAALFITFKRNQETSLDDETNFIRVKSKLKSEFDPNSEIVSESTFSSINMVPNIKIETEFIKKLPDESLSYLNTLSTVEYEESSFDTNSCKMVLLVLPATLISHWIEVFNKWYYPIRIILFHGKVESERRAMFDQLREMEKVSTELLVITTYETLRRNLQTLRQISWFYVILDEGHKIRNPDSGITLAVKSLGTCNRLLLSGSPIQNDLKELWSLIDFVYPGKLGTLPVFEQQFVIPIKQAELRNAAKVQTMRALNCTRILQELIKACILRRRKHELQDILKLPSQAEHVLFCNLTSVQYDVYCSCLDLLQAKQLVKNKMYGISKYFALLNILREVCNHPELLKLVRRQNKNGEIDSDFDFYEDKEDENGLSTESIWNRTLRNINVNGGDSGKYQALMSILKLWRDKKEHRVLIFTQGVRTLKLLCTLLENDLGLIPNEDVLTLDGSTPLSTRFSLVKRFNQNPSIFLFILTSRVGGVGLNITGANRVILYDPWWNPMTDVQAKERCWRIGQKKEVIVYRLITRDTIEEKIFQRQLFKEFIAKQILKDPKSQSSLNWSNFNELVKKPRKPKNYVSDPKLVSNYIRNIKNIWGGKTRQRKDGNTYSSYFDDFDMYDKGGYDDFDNRRSIDSGRKEVINDELNLFGEITFDAKSEHNAIMSILGDSNDDNLVSKSIGSSNSSNCSANSHTEGSTQLYSGYLSDDLAEATNEIIKTSIELIKQSEIERSNYDYSVPTWTGKSGHAGAPSSVILRNLRRQRAIQGGGGLGSLEGSEDGSRYNAGGWDEESIRRRLTEYFMKRERLGIKTSTDDLLSSFGELIPDSSHGLFRKILKQICTLNKSNNVSSKENYWVLKKKR
ncbi:SNF2 family N-terminal domain protein [Cryptosporidium meleagridis]|uniref:SNF2 family N-terminal domain protein n=1 Tax=Cryptosporidium meleagridis TaxID=93969 RepID=A0A2P4Z538_9CRYT|nr:SNF2 family N-terminal domain protein [Cryptosporidium meleagridis]